jgi:hypothetical protein
MLTRISLLAWALLAATGAASKSHVINSETGDIAADSDVARHLLHHARRVDQNQNQNDGYDYQNVDTSFLAGYSVKFQGCHHVQQWNSDADDEDDVRIMTKRLVRFRLCPASDCVSDLTGCTSRYGDYVVDMGTFMSAYMENNGNNNNGNNNGNNNNNGGERALDQNFDVSNYLECGEFDMRRRLDQNGDNYNNNDDNEDSSYYLGPYCADQGGEIRMGMFTDDTCTSFAQNGETQFYQSTGSSLPYSEQSMVSFNCMSCNNGNYEANDFCSGVYAYSGKCETKMNIDYPNESSCSYIEGIKIIREDGVIRTTATKKSKAAAVSIGVFLTIAVLLSGYVYYLRTSK